MNRFLAPLACAVTFLVGLLEPSAAGEVQMAVWPVVFAATAAVATVGGAVMSYNAQKQAQANAQAQAQQQQQMLQYQSQLAQQQAQVQNAMAQRQATLMQAQVNQQATLMEQQVGLQSEMAQRQAELNAQIRRQQALEAAETESENVVNMRAERRRARARIEAAYAATGVALQGTPAALLTDQREFDEEEFQAIHSDGNEQRSLEYWAAEEERRGALAAAEVEAYLGRQEAGMVRMQGSLDQYRIEAESAYRTYDAGVQSTMLDYRGRMAGRVYDNPYSRYATLLQGVGNAASIGMQYRSMTNSPSTRLSAPYNPSGPVGGSPSGSIRAGSYVSPLART